ncbi:facilitated trehalose transporter Tret1-like [Epargyreus clarus]|uniref:facilitated trehalose transporter Tret1-like n=1 Tax=Epargyreus clarus TaxID=520877 RepID=UPI003C2F4168
MSGNYQVVGLSEESKKPFLRQLHIASGVWALFFMNGLCTGAPTVFIPQLRRQANSTEYINDELASWLYSLSNLSAIPWVFILPSFTQSIGRKTPYLAACFAMSTCNIILYFSTNPYHILIAEALQGFVNASNTSVLFHIIPEYCNPIYRTMFLNIQSTSFYWGMWASNAIGTFCNWKYIPILGFISSLYAITVVCIPESPYWLASKKRFRECETSHRWLRGTTNDAETQLHDLVKSQTEIKNKTVITFVRKEFYLPLMLAILVSAQYIFSGKFVCSIYAIDIIKKITKNEDTAYIGMLILDGITVVGMYVGSVLSTLKTRSSYLTLSFLSIGFMFTISLYLYLVKMGVVFENNIISLCLLVAYSLVISVGPMIQSLSIYSEIIPVKYQRISYMIASFTFLSSCTAMLKFSPYIFKEFGIHGSFLFYGISSGICTVLLYFYLPETNNKTLLEIEECFKDKSETEPLR